MVLGLLLVRSLKMCRLLSELVLFNCWICEPSHMKEIKQAES